MPLTRRSALPSPRFASFLAQVTLAEKKIEAIRKEAEEEKKLMVTQLKNMYYQLVQLNDLESQAVEAAKTRGEIHMDAIGTTKRLVLDWFKSGAGNKL